MPGEQRPLSNKLVMPIALVIGLLWIATAVIAILSAARGWGNDRPDWALGWGLVGAFLLIAGSAAIIGAWWHQYHVRRHD